MTKPVKWRVYLCGAAVSLFCIQGIVIVLWAMSVSQSPPQSSSSGAGAIPGAFHDDNGARYAHSPTYVSAESYRMLSSLSDSAWLHRASERISIDRLPESDGHAEVRRFIMDTLQGLGWRIILDEFVADTPVGKKHYSNIIALSPGSDVEMESDKMVLAAHYETKYFAPPSAYVGATDAAVSCAILLDVARTLSPHIAAQNRNRAGGTGAGAGTGTGLGLDLMLIFFDGEEAWDQWTESDSIYGARHLAAGMEAAAAAAAAAANKDKDGAQGKQQSLPSLKTMNMLVLLDLIGSRETQFFSQYSNTRSVFNRLARIESRLRSDRLLETQRRAEAEARAEPKHEHSHEDEHEHEYQRMVLKVPFFSRGQTPFVSLDDHVPFLRRGVPVVHLITTPYPAVWHTDADTMDIVDPLVAADVSTIIRIFVVEYLRLQVK